MGRVGRLATVMLLGLALTAPPSFARSEVFNTYMYPGQVSPPGPGGGRARIAVQVDDDRNYICYLAQWDGVGEPTGLHVHRGGPGTERPMVIDLRITEFHR